MTLVRNAENVVIEKMALFNGFAIKREKAKERERKRKRKSEKEVARKYEIMTNICAIQNTLDFAGLTINC